MQLRSCVSILVATSIGLVVGCDEPLPTPAPKPASSAASVSYSDAVAASKTKLAELRTFLTGATNGLEDTSQQADVACPAELASRVGAIWDDGALVLSDESLAFFTQESPEFPEEGTTGFKPGPPRWTKSASGMLATLGRGGVIFDALESLAFKKPKYGTELMEQSSIKASEKLGAAFAKMPSLLVLYRSADIAARNIEGENVKTDTRTGEKSIAIKGGSSFGKVVVIDPAAKRVLCHFRVDAANSGSFHGSAAGNVTSSLIGTIEDKLGGKKGLFKPKL